MKYPRFRVATCEGYPITTAHHSRTRKPGLSATVCDTLHAWKEVRTYRSEDRVFRNGMRLARGVDGARRDAEDHAAYLSEQHRREMHTEAVRAGRAVRARQATHG